MEEGENETPGNGSGADSDVAATVPSPGDVGCKQAEIVTSQLTRVYHAQQTTLEILSNLFCDESSFVTEGEDSDEDCMDDGEVNEIPRSAAVGDITSQLLSVTTLLSILDLLETSDTNLREIDQCPASSYREKVVAAVCGVEERALYCF